MAAQPPAVLVGMTMDGMLCAQRGESWVSNSNAQVLWCKEIAMCRDAPCALHVEENGDFAVHSAVGLRATIAPALADKMRGEHWRAARSVSLG